MLFEFKSKKIYESDALFCKKIIAMATFSYLEGHFSPIPCLLFNSFAYLCIMILKRLSILNYRNIATAELCFSPKINCFVGHNGEGKTNILDSIYFLSMTKSTTSALDSMNVRHGEIMMMVQGLYDLNGTEEEISIGMKLHQKKHVQRNKKEYKRLTEHIGLLPIIIASPADHTIISGGSEDRRRLMDTVIAQYDPEYMNDLTNYNKAMQQRNAMLKAEEMPIEEIISVFEEIMAETGERIYKKRREFVEEFVPVFQHFYAQISGGEEEVGLIYTSHCDRGNLLTLIQRGRGKDHILGYSLHGVHKDDLDMSLGGYPIKREGSQGQNKTFMLALKLAQFDFLKRTGSKTTPLLLLDDIFDKLDAKRVEHIVEIVSNDAFGQIFITDTNRENLDKILARSHGDYKIFNVEGGNISEFSADRQIK